MLWDQEKKAPSYKRIWLAVIALHVFFLFILHVQDVKNNVSLKPKLVVQNFLEKKPFFKKRDKIVEQALASQIAGSRNEKEHWEEKREEFFKEKLDSLTQIKKAKEQAHKKDLEALRSLVEADQKASLAKPDQEKKTSSPILKKTISKPAAWKALKTSPKNGSSLKTASKTKKIAASSNRLEEGVLEKRRQQIETLQKSLSKIEETENQTHRTQKGSSAALGSSEVLSVPVLKKENWTASLASEDLDSFLQMSDQETFSWLFISFLKEELQLPKVGKVKLKIWLDISGKVQKLEVLEAENRENQNYLETVLPTLEFAFLKDYLKKEKSFIITFLNEDEK